jgi:hypothetical protein
MRSFFIVEEVKKRGCKKTYVLKNLDFGATAPFSLP